MSQEQTTEPEQPEPQTDYSRGIGQPTPGGRYADMEPANPLPKETFGEETFKSDRDGIEQAADEVAQRRQEAREERQAKTPLPREYQQQGGPKSGERSPVHQSVTPEQAAHDLARSRESEVSAEQAALDLELRRQIDALRAGDTAQPDQQQPQETYQPQEQPQEQGQPAQVDPLIEELQRSPKLMEAVGQYNAQVEQQVAQVQQQYLAGLSQNAAVAYAAVTASFPELRSVADINQIPIVVQTVAQSNPDRARAMVAHLQEVNQLVEQAQTATAQYQQQQVAAQRQAFSNFAQQHDDAFQKHFDTVVPAAQQRDVQDEARAMLNEQGLSDQEISALWETPAFRSVAAQKVILDATLYRRAQRGAQQKVARPVPTVQRPGSPAARGSEEDYNLSKYSAALDRSGSAKDAAALLTARRAHRR